MNRIWPEDPWEAHGCALGMSAPGKPLEERLTMLGRRNGWSRRKFLGAGLLLAAGAPLALVPWQVSAQERQGEAEELAQQWEDVLLLDALRYLRVTRVQMRQLRSMACVTDERLTKLQAQETKTRAALQRIAQKQRRALLSGETVSLQEQANALLLEDTLRPNQEAAAAEITAYAAPRMSRILTSDQIERAFLLVHGEMPPNVARRPALLDPGSGFVLTVDVREGSRRDSLRRVFARRLPPEMAGNLARDLAGMAPDCTLLSSPKGRVAPNCDSCHASPPEGGLNRFAGGQLATGIAQLNDRDREALARWSVLAKSLVDGASEDDLAHALRHLTRRLFTSPRFRTALDQRSSLSDSGMEPVAPDEGEQK